MRRLLLFLFMVLLSINLAAQTEDVQVVTHEVKAGETIKLISKKYLVTPSDIYQFNEFAIDGISAGMVLQIPIGKSVHKKEQKPAAAVAKDPVSSPAQVDDVNTLEGIMDSLEDGQPTQDTTPTSTETRAVSHKVLPGETLSALSRKYGVPVAVIQSENPTVLEHGLKAGQTIVIRAAVLHQPSAEATATDRDSVKHHEPEGFISHTVEPKETLYSISKRFNVSVEDIKIQNEKILAHGLQAGQVIKIKPNN
ncbi:MAG TPA: LysM peptidoglycan-binding domain-containing protein [Flavobacterium sp.]|jgi:LysM repeat protein